MFATPMVGRAECDRAIAVIRVGGEQRPAGARLRSKHAARPRDDLDRRANADRRNAVEESSWRTLHHGRDVP